jgi:hypothetical protein
MRTFAPKQRPALFAQNHARCAIPPFPRAGPALQRKEMTAKTKLDRVLRAAARAQLDPNDRASMARNGVEIVYRLIDLYLPVYNHLLSGVSYKASVATTRAEPTAGGTVSITIGKKFILETNDATLALRTTEIGTALSRWKSQFKVDPQERRSFKKRVWALMDALMTSSKPGLSQLYERMLHSSVPITVRSVTDDVSTWHVKEARMDPDDRPIARERRSHTDPSDLKGRGAERDEPTGSTIFINPFRIDPSDTSYESGTFVHELVHALDLAYGLYNSEKEIRERRAVFFQNMWRDARRDSLRESYHGDFVTDDYQRAVIADSKGDPNGVVDVTAHLFSHNDFPQEN